MYPEVFGIIKSYGLMLAISFALGLWMCTRRAKAHDIEAETVTDVIFGILISSIVGVRFFYVLTHLGDFHPWYRAFFIWDGGLTLYGGFIFASIAVFIMARRRRIPFLVLADIIAPPLMLCLGLSRFGCFFAGCCYGQPTDLDIGVMFPLDSPAVKQFGPVPVHPSQLYASTGGFVIYGLLLLLEKVWNYRGASFGRFLALYGVSRFVVDFSRYYEPEQVVALGWSNNQWISVGLMLGGLIVLLSQSRDNQPQEEFSV